MDHVPDRIQAEEDLMDAVRAVTGKVPPELFRILKILSHPEVGPYTLEYFAGSKAPNRCLIYADPWDCAKDTEAKYETIGEGRLDKWLAGQQTEDQWQRGWCEPCRNKARQDR